MENKITQKERKRLRSFGAKHPVRLIDNPREVPEPSGISSWVYSGGPSKTLGAYVVSNCIATRAYSDERLKRDSNNKRFVGPSGSYFHQRLAEEDPLYKKITDLKVKIRTHPAGGEFNSSIFYELLNRGMKEEEYMGCLSGNKPVGIYTFVGNSLAGNKITETLETFLDDTSEKGFSFGRVLSHKNEGTPYGL